ncbi:MAG: Formate dehydrogenase, alpha subunit, archaeal-type [Atribacteria bacterium 34_128]|jgi:formate dehydrogenase alpha subunit|nr:MAG: Formate dehydrogenase, alpha subunit, archaeal-type [Atribacteria bacterium 34_128]
MTETSPKLVNIICPYCGVGCNFELVVKDGKVTKTKVTGRNPQVNEKFVCIKGLTIYELINHSERLKTPLIRTPKGFKEACWKAALKFIAERLMEIKEKYGPGSIGILCSAKILNEEVYLAQKFFRTIIGTNNIDTCARLCHASSEVGLRKMLGYGTVSIWWPDLLEADTVMMVGENARFSHPILWNILKSREEKFNLIVADAARTPVIKNVEIYINPKPGTDLIWLCGVAKILYEEKLYDEEFIKNNTIGFESFIKSLDWCIPEYVKKVSGVMWEDLEKIAYLISREKRTIFVWGMGLTQHPHGTKNVMAIANLALMTGNIGKPGAGVTPLRGQNNVQGAVDMGASPTMLPGYYPIPDEVTRLHFEGVWETKIPSKPGLSAPEMIHVIAEGKIKALYVIGENPLLSEPQSDFVKWMFQSLELLVVQDIFITETAKLAHVVLPAAMIGKKGGTLTNAARRIQLTEKAIDPPGEAKEDWKILIELAKIMGTNWNYTCAEDIWNEVRRLVPIFAGASYRRLRRGYGFLWPVYSEDHQGIPRLYTDGFAFFDRRARFMPIEPPKSIIVPTEEYPYLLVTCRLYEHFNTGEMTRRSKLSMRASPELFACMNEGDAKELGIKEGDKIKVSSPYGMISCPVKIGMKNLHINRGILAVPIHFFNKHNFNRLISAYPLDPDSKTPPLKVIPVKVEKVKT